MALFLVSWKVIKKLGFPSVLSLFLAFLCSLTTGFLSVPVQTCHLIWENCQALGKGTGIFCSILLKWQIYFEKGGRQQSLHLKYRHNNVHGWDHKHVLFSVSHPACPLSCLGFWYLSLHFAVNQWGNYLLDCIGPKRRNGLHSLILVSAHFSEGMTQLSARSFPNRPLFATVHSRHIFSNCAQNYIQIDFKDIICVTRYILVKENYGHVRKT